jgi:Zn-dependent protease with chaperone function
MMPLVGKLLIVAGAILVVLGVVFLFADRIPWLGRLPGDIVFKRGRTTVYVPLVTMLIVSLLLTLILNLFSRK